MSDVNGAQAPAETQIQLDIPAPAVSGPVTPRDAQRSLTDWRHKQNAKVRDALNGSTAVKEPAAESKQPIQQVDGAAPAAEPAQQSEAQADDTAAAQEQPPGETQEANPAEQELPPVEPPRSWTTEDKEIFKGLPRETQERLVDRERSREKELRRSQDEAAAKLKDLSAKELAAEKAKQDYDAALPVLLQNLATAPEWADVKTQADVDAMLANDPIRYLKWQNHLQKTQSVAQELKSAQERQATDAQKRFTDYGKEQDELFEKQAPEMANSETATKARERAVEVLKDIGFADDELAKLWHGQSALSMRDHRFQLLVRDAMRYRDAQAKAKVAAPKPLPPVQRPGVSAPKGADQDAKIQALQKQLKTATGIQAVRIGADLLRAQRAKAALSR